MIRDTAKPPHERRMAVEGFRKGCNFPQDPVLTEFQVTVRPKLHEMQVRVLDQPELIYKDKAGVSADSNIGLYFFTSLELKARLILTK
jgi:hypothetical protein